MKELKIYEEIRVRCVEDKTDDGCKECFFNNRYHTCHMRTSIGVGACVQHERSDSKNVHFEIMNEPTGQELLHVANKTAERTKKEMIRKACQWICDNCEGKEDCLWANARTDCPTIKAITKSMED